MNAPIRSLTYRRMTESDLDDVLAIESAVHAHPWTPGNFRDSLEAGHECWIAERNLRVVAYGVVLIGAGEAHLLNLSVAADCQRQGIGTELTRFVVKFASDCGAETIFLEVRPSNTAARALYARSGFAEIGLRLDYYPAPGGREDAVVMELTLK